MNQTSKGMKKIIVVDDRGAISHLASDWNNGNAQEQAYAAPKGYAFNGFKQNGETLVIFISQLAGDEQ